MNQKTQPDTYQQTRSAHWDEVARSGIQKKSRGNAYHKRLAEVYRFLVPPGARVLEIGCGQGDLLAALHPRVGVGLDFSAVMVKYARERHPKLTFHQMDAHDFSLEGKMFDAVILSDLINDVRDVKRVLEQIKPHTHSRTRIIMNYYSRLWEIPLGLVRKLNLATPNLLQNWLTAEDVENLLYLAEYEVIRNWHEILLPLRIPFLGRLANRVLVKIRPFNWLALTNFTIARPKPKSSVKVQPSVSVIVPARNEEGNIPAIMARVPEMGAGTELIFVEGNSRDNTYQAIEHAIALEPDRNVKLLKQPGVGKYDAVKVGFAAATGDILMILDADLTVPPEDLPGFYEALVSGKGDFINGVRLVYPMEKEAMRFLNLLGNKFFSLMFSWLLGQPIKDTLCGTKVLWKQDYELIAANRAYFGDFDPFGDFDLIFGATKLGMKIIDYPVRYQERTYGTTNIDRWRHGVLLLKMVGVAARRLKFV